MTRITHQSTYNRQIAQLRQRSAALEDARTRAATGKAFAKPSDNPRAAAAAADLQVKLDRYDALATTHDVAAGELAAADGALGSLTDVLDRTQLIVKAAAGAQPTSQDVLDGYADELEELRDQVLGIVNTTFAGRQLFAGTADVAESYDAAGTYQGNTDTHVRTIAPGMDLSTGVPGTDLLEGADARTLLQVIDDAVARLDVGDQAGVAANDVDAVTAYRDQVVQVRAELGSRTNTLEATIDRIEGDKLLLGSRLDAAEGVAIDEVIVELTTAQTGYQAALVAISRAQGLTLANYMA